MSRHRAPSHPTAYRNSHPIVVPGLSRYSSPANSPTAANHPAYRNKYNYSTTTSGSARPRHSNTYYQDSGYKSSSYPSASKKPEKGLSYTSTRDISGWLGGAALTAGAAYLLRGSNGAVYGGSRDAKRSRDRDAKYYYEDKYDSRGRDRDRDRGRYHDDVGRSRGRAKSERRPDGGRDRERSRDRGRGGGRYYYY
ncbi:uncharacterized protein AB675_2587 [Cyphellophora attinorum]|uniref:Uncharacterized protein n=1 Tax=Cyphellophora attinorum TaxID=1664694 RepID=A0A0N1HHB9_9EURO|nr:uncharacterized protein AB675_2587 [Phialophora attinorum]KPI45333.1 hypothetical protein AB675_2587 [Phialophora attinorum]